MSPLFPGIVASGISGNLYTLAGDYDAIDFVTVPSGGVASITFTGIPGNYKHLQIRGVSRTTDSVTDGNTNMQFNGDTSANYSGHYFFGNGAGPAAGGGGGATAMDTIRLTGANSTASTFGAGVIDILDYSSTTKNKTVYTNGGNEQNGTNLFINFSGAWASLTPVVSITMKPSSGSFAQHSSFALYGVK